MKTNVVIVIALVIWLLMGSDDPSRTMFEWLEIIKRYFQ